MRKSYLAILLILIPCFALAASHSLSNPTVRLNENFPFTTGSETVDAPVIFPPYNVPFIDGTDETEVIGTTWYDIQHNGTVGRMLEVDEDGYIHFVWMNGTNSGAADRHVYYNYIRPDGTQGWPGTGYAVESAQRGGYTTMDVDFGGIAFPTFHQVTATSQNAHTATGADFFPHSGAFLVYEPDWLYVSGQEMEVIWPRCMFDRDGILHVVSTENPASGVAGDPQRVYYTYGTYNASTFSVEFPPTPDTWTEMTWTMTIAADFATSDVSDRIAFGWTFGLEPGFPGPDPSQRDNDIYLLIDDDGEDLHFGDFFNLTQFIPPDESLLPDTLAADKDTLRAYTDMNIFIDSDDWVHCVFTTPSFFALEGTSYWHASLVWHWSEQFPGEYQLVHNAFDDWTWNFTDCGVWNYKAQRPELGQDADGNLYCMYQVYDCDTLAISQGGFPSGEIYVSKSIDGGQNWTIGTNVTNTITPRNAPAGQCQSEITPSMSKVVDDYVHIMYVLDKDAGTVVQTEGGWTINDVVYNKVPVDNITGSLVPQDVPFHVDPVLNVPGSGRYTPSEFALEQNFPNPFNPSTSIQFSLDAVSDISLKVYNLNGQEVATVASGTYSIGAHTVNFDASHLSSGVYLYKLEAGGRSLTQKMLLMK